MAIESLIAGGLLRLAPEIANIFDKRNQRKHDREMAKINAEARRGEQDRDNAGKAIEAVTEVSKAQLQLTGVKFVDGWNMLMRPIIATQWVVFLYPGFLIAQWLELTGAGMGATQAYLTVFGQPEKDICNMIIGFFFLDRVMKYMK
jgi:hypothetical protein